MLGGWTCEIAGPRAISQVKMTIHQRASLEGVLVDVACMGRFYDFFEKRQGRWGIVRRQPIYEKDRLDPVDPSAVLRLDAEILARYPEGYRHLAYLQLKNGFSVKMGLPGLRGPEVEKLYAEGQAWMGKSSCFAQAKQACVFPPQRATRITGHLVFQQVVERGQERRGFFRGQGV